LDSEGRVGDYTSITIGADGLPIISYLDSTNLNLKVAHCGDPACSAGNTITTLDSEGHVGWFTSITIGADGLPIISYLDVTNNTLKVAHCSNPFCTPYFRRR
jgi:predicted regulator of Ras-like GTPase activity (Roadblock/LC7/MglB family)